MKIEAVEITSTEPHVWAVAINGIYFRLDNVYPTVWTTEALAVASIPDVLRSVLDKPEGHA